MKACFFGVRRLSVFICTLALLPLAAVACDFEPNSVVVPDGMLVGVSVYDREKSKYLAEQDSHRPFMAASLTKLLLAIGFYKNNPSPTRTQKDTIDRMLSASDDDVASAMYRNGGKKAMIQSVVAEIGLDDTTPPPAGHNGWGATITTANDIVKVYQYILDSDASVREPIMAALSRFIECSADGFNQKYGLFAFAEDDRYSVAVAKQGWYAFANTPASGSCDGSVSGEAHAKYSGNAATVGGVDWSREFLHTTGIVGDSNRYIVAVLTSSSAGTSFADANSDLEEVLNSALGGV
ncbi:MAG: hypothetical protein PVI21_02250 [Candidatus Woesebacteria bacterium]